MPRVTRPGAAHTTIRRATKPDADAIAALGVRTYREHFTAIWEPAALEAWLQAQFDLPRVLAEIVSDDVRYDLFLVDGVPVGYSKLLRDRPTPLSPALVGCELQKIYFTRETTGFGYGLQLLQHAISVAREWLQDFVWLGVLKSNEGAKRLYEGVGFEVIGETALPAAVHDRGMWVMRRNL